jgi:hypothetical protein
MDKTMDIHTPSSPWTAGVSNSAGSSLEDVCANTVTGAFDKPLLNDSQLVNTTTASSLSFQLT